MIEQLTLHWSMTFQPEKINDYVVSLSKFDDATLERAMIFLRNECEMPPRLATIIKACKENKTITHSHSERPEVWLQKRREEEELKMQRSRTKAKDYLESKIAEIKYKIEGWSAYHQNLMLDYIAKTALFQAQRIEKVKNIGYMTPFICNSGQEPQKRLDWWKTMNLEAIDDINVIVPWLWFEGKEQENAA